MDWLLQEGEHVEVSLLLITITLGFMAYWFTVENDSLRSWLKIRFGERNGSVFWFVGNKLLGTLLFGLLVPIVSLLLFPDLSFGKLGFRPPSPNVGWLLAIILTVVLAFMSWNKNRRIARSSGSFGRYPEIQVPDWTWRTLTLHVGLWMLYLLAYEFMFRGVLLFVGIASLGFPIAVGLNVALYGLAHVPKGAQEAIGAVILGYVLCVLTYASSSIFFAWIIHCALAITNGLSAMYYRTDMRIIKTGRRV